MSEPTPQRHVPIRALQVAKCSCGYQGRGWNFDVAHEDVWRHVIEVDPWWKPLAKVFYETGLDLAAEL